MSSSAVYAKDNTAVITGGASGIGFALAKKCIGYGMRVLVADLNEASLDAAKSALGDNASTVRIDVGKFGDWNILKEKVERDFGGLLPLTVLKKKKPSFSARVSRSLRNPSFVPP